MVMGGEWQAVAARGACASITFAAGAFSAAALVADPALALAAAAAPIPAALTLQPHAAGLLAQ